jgi:hypothetical protein
MRWALVVFSRNACGSGVQDAEALMLFGEVRRIAVTRRNTSLTPIDAFGLSVRFNVSDYETKPQAKMEIRATRSS